MAKILIVDDCKFIHGFVGPRLCRAGHKVVASGFDGNQGALLYLHHQPDLVLMDVTMPNCDGRESLKKILKANPRAKVLIFSASQASKIIAECLAIGAVGFLNKDRLKVRGHLEMQILLALSALTEAGERAA